MSKINYEKYLAKIIECEYKKDSSIEHEWTFNTANEAVKVANYLRNHGYKAVYKKSIILNKIPIFYVGVSFKFLNI